MVSNTFTEKIVAGILASSFLIPAFTLAEGPATTSTTTPRDAKAFCTNLPALRAKTLTHLTDRVATIEEKKTDRQTKFEAGRAERHTKLATARTTRDTEREARYEKLRGRASTTDQTTAVTTFAAEVERLVTVRKAAVDVAIKTFEDAVFALQTTNQAAVANFATTMQADINKVFDDAAASCAAGKTGPEVKAQIKSAMEAVRATRLKDVKAHATSTQFKVLQDARKASVEAAKTAFKIGLDAASADLKKAFTK